MAIVADERVSGMWAKKNAAGKEDVVKLIEDTYRKMQVSFPAAMADNDGHTRRENLWKTYEEPTSDTMLFVI